MEIAKRKICIFIESQLRPAIIQNTYSDSHHSYAKGLIPQKGEAVMDGDVKTADENSKLLPRDIVTKLVNSIPHGQNSLIFR